MVRISGYLFVFGLFVCVLGFALYLFVPVEFCFQYLKIANNIFRLILQVNNMFGCWL